VLLVEKLQFMLFGTKSEKTAVSRDRVCSHMYWYRNMPIINN
jgi:hypothetical protein